MKTTPAPRLVAPGRGTGAGIASVTSDTVQRRTDCGRVRYFAGPRDRGLRSGHCADGFGGLRAGGNKSHPDCRPPEQHTSTAAPQGRFGFSIHKERVSQLSCMPQPQRPKGTGWAEEEVEERVAVGADDAGERRFEKRQPELSTAKPPYTPWQAASLARRASISRSASSVHELSPLLHRSGVPFRTTYLRRPTTHQAPDRRPSRR